MLLLEVVQSSSELFLLLFVLESDFLLISAGVGLDT